MIGFREMKLRLRRLPILAFILPICAFVGATLVFACGSDVAPTLEPPTPLPTAASETEESSSGNESNGIARFFRICNS